VVDWSETSETVCVDTGPNMFDPRTFHRSLGYILETVQQSSCKMGTFEFLIEHSQDDSRMCPSVLGVACNNIDLFYSLQRQNDNNDKENRR